jgi:hypothetical protein
MNLAVDTVMTVRAARGAVEQQAALDAWVQQRQSAAGKSGLAVIAEGAFFELTVPHDVTLERLAAGCVCCIGLLPLQVTLTRLLRKRPRAVLLLVADAAHIERVRALAGTGRLGVSLEAGE